MTPGDAATPRPKERLATEQAFAVFESILNADGARAALGFLAAQTSYRFIGIFRFEGGMANAAIHYDRENPTVTRIDAVPESATYCCYVRDSLGTFTTVDALEDARLTAHPKRAALRAYCGVPVMDSEGVLLGTLCHYDPLPRDPAELDLPLLLQAASALAQGNHVPPYPNAG